jgi:UDP-N-acetylglucosamine 3-dehydrogenase
MMDTVGPIMGNLIHDIDLALWYSGAKAVSVYAQTVSVRGLKYPDIAQVMLRLDSGATAMLESVACMAEGSPFDIDERMELIGDKGFIHVQETFPNIGIVTKDGFRSPDTTYWPSWRGQMRGALPDELAYFARCVLDGKAPDIITLEEALAATRVTLAAEESAASGEIVPL